MKTYIYLFITLSLFISCTRSAVVAPQDIKFTVMSNTYSDSPYSYPNKFWQQTVEIINKINPVIAFHAGDIICGGRNWVGIKEKDVSAQYNSFYNIFSELKPILYTVKGDMDILNNSSEIYTEHTKKSVYYSFNYGTIHFITLDSTDPGPGLISKDQMKWLVKDLYKNKNAYAIFIFIHHPLFVPNQKEFEDNAFCKNTAELHNNFIKYNVKAVFSGHLPDFYRMNKDGIEYVTAGCSYNDKRYNKLYFVDFSVGDLKISPLK